ncbi:MAG: imidazole glycerol phosphate synthase subunit HisF [Phycisphaerae bacterium]
MLTRRVIPCLDVRAGRVVKGVRFQGLRDSGEASELAARYEAEGADELVMLDIAATPEARSTAAETVAKVRRVLGIPLTVGGGVRAVQDAARLLDAGADKVALNTAAVLRPELLGECAERFGTQCVVVAIDAAHATSEPPRWGVRVRSGEQGTAIDAVEWAVRAQAMGAGEVLLTSWDRDGTRAGYDLPLTAAVASAVRIPVIASGGAASPEHLLAALEVGADAVLAAGIFHEGLFSVGEVKRFLSSRGVEVRP